ncbi:MAG: hypothetical protein WBV39_10005, partial [Rudaea sp.]
MSSNSPAPHARTGSARRDSVMASNPIISASDNAVATLDPWYLRQSHWQRENAARDETLFALANGAIGVRGGFEE